MLQGQVTRSLFQHPAPYASSFQRHNILCEEQHDFRSGRSCETQLLNTIDDLAKNLDHRNQTDVILDFSKAFNKVTVFSTLLYRNNIVTTIMI